MPPRSSVTSSRSTPSRGSSQISDHRQHPVRDGRSRSNAPIADQLSSLPHRFLTDEHVDLALAGEQPLHQMASDEARRTCDEVGHLDLRARIPSGARAGAPAALTGGKALCAPAPPRRPQARLGTRARVLPPASCPCLRSRRGGPRASSAAGSEQGPRPSPMPAVDGSPSERSR